MSAEALPAATYRLQFHHGFRFIAAQALVPYLHALGISHLYASPFFKARRQSLHGYSVTNPLEINPELGSRVSFTALVRALKAKGMGLILDIVPNHMALSPDNPWWQEVLEDGPASPYAVFFDIDWQPPQRFLSGKVLLPILGSPYHQVLENQELVLTLEEKGFVVHYHDLSFPLDPKTYSVILSHRLEELAAELGPEDPALLALQGLITLSEHLPPRSATGRKKLQERQRTKKILKKSLWLNYLTQPAIRRFLDENLARFNGTRGEAASFDLLDRLLGLQAYRLAWWQVALDFINYRRFFSVNDLIGLRVEDPQVFEASHALLFHLVREDKIAGLRIDHIDGLFDPAGYLQRLAEQLRGLVPERGREPFFVVVEKILAPGETLPPEWPVAGTTGYDFLDRVTGLFVHPGGLDKVRRIYARFTGMADSWPEVVYEKKKLVLESLFGGELENLGHQLRLLAEQDRQARDIPRADLREALEEVIASLPQYRTYIRSLEVRPMDQDCLERGLAAARQRRPDLNPLALHFLRRVLLLDFPPHFPEEQKREWLHFVMRWQQFTGPITAKGLEDTALYVYHPLAALNEVGTAMEAVTPAAFHAFQEARRAAWPHTLNATSTHDTKRSEDVRLRLAVLSELPEEWEARLRRWRALNRHKKRQVRERTAPDPNEEYFLYQTFLGAWPLLPEERDSFPERLTAYLVKAAREAKVHSHWTAPDAEYEGALTAFARELLREGPDNEFLPDFLEFQALLAWCGALNSLSQVLLKIAAPGIPDFYQGTELWDFSLVDPDNRRPVDFRRRTQLLRELHRRAARGPEALLPELWANWRRGEIKLYLTATALNFRRAHLDLFLEGDYLPLAAAGPQAGRPVAFARRRGEDWVVAVAGRFFAGLGEAGRYPGGAPWHDTVLLLPPEAPPHWQEILSGRRLSTAVAGPGRQLPLGPVLEHLPAALLWGRRG
ncbi:MAG: malto-oligosyltrehalose synthase [Syntrophobacterales bacterium]|nr:malto-oligosyltrehalose synthase [Syntrophobacterales bacterium]